MSELNEKLATAWEGFTKGDWQNEVTSVTSFRKTTLRTRVTSPSWLALLKRPPPCGTK
ncbi:formate acetyltransferase 1 [Escherichia coli]|uniref:Formate acetyltransferase 1 n=1 Tax=Escherichia coli TaxID=562 RepID=A0A377CZE5_ECOLX|nr:formate acetyltransferase 1 [Escherichia coli]